MNVGIVLPSPKGGGVFQYALSIVESVSMHSARFNYFLLYYDKESLTYLSHHTLPRERWVCIPLRASSLRSRIRLLFNLTAGMIVFSGQERETQLKLKNSRIQLVIVPFPSLFGFSHEIPYLVSIVDLMHRYYPRFPEYPLRERLVRDIIYKNAARHSVLTVVDDWRGSEDLQTFYKIPHEKIRIIPYVPPGYIYGQREMSLKAAEGIVARYHLPERFLFYPAQFWYHKNHLRLVEALEHIQQVYHVAIPVVLVGSPREGYESVMSFVERSSIKEHIIYLGYVTGREIVALYKRAVALVFPSLFGPTNIPPLEAMILGTPVVCSNVFSMPAQVDSAGLLFNPLSVEDMAEKIYRVWIDEHLRQELIERGYQRVRDMTLENYAKQWEKIIAEALEKMGG